MRLGVTEANFTNVAVEVEVMGTPSVARLTSTGSPRGGYPVGADRRPARNPPSLPITGHDLCYGRRYGAGVRKQVGGIAAGGSSAAEDLETAIEHRRAAACNTKAGTRARLGADPSGNGGSLPASSS